MLFFNKAFLAVGDASKAQAAVLGVDPRISANSSLVVLFINTEVALCSGGSDLWGSCGSGGCGRGWIAADDTRALFTFDGVVSNLLTLWTLLAWPLANVVALAWSLLSKIEAFWTGWNLSWNTNWALESALVDGQDFFLTWTAGDSLWNRSFLVNNVPLAWATKTTLVLGQSSVGLDNKLLADWVVFWLVGDRTVAVGFDVWNLTRLAVVAISLATDLFSL